MNKVAFATLITKKEASLLLELESWYSKIFLVKRSHYNYWLIDLAADIYICNNQSLMIEYNNKPIKIGGSTSNRLSLGRRKI